MRTFRCIYVNYFNRLRFITEGQHKIARNALFLDNLRTITQEVNRETRKLTSFLSFTFSALTACNIHF